MIQERYFKTLQEQKEEVKVEAEEVKEEVEEKRDS